ncbi:hypothetical protein CVD28_01780 [Bacillus sp. M6-12]|uniref:hypothetical protein n=1 Tax=Bacillus sp. M6-12 TaxID=2054166 RepID=UPI000C76355C|nr:hypothetical protein [Bacillus sp. M6-12]PLS19162.1 hypothetical protein CVD28_01780 [Bacillus sp. M6-12]
MEKELDITVCPNCSQDENTIKYDEWLGKELWYCEDCDSFYDVLYEVTVKEVKLRPKQKGRG